MKELSISYSAEPFVNNRVAGMEITRYSVSECAVCSAPVTVRKPETCLASGSLYGKEVVFLRCDTCGFVSAPENLHEFDSEHDFRGTDRPAAMGGRIGTDRHPGREYHMASMAREILVNAGREPNSILIFGAGLSPDHRRLAKDFPSIRVCVSDLRNFQNTENFVEMDASETFDIVVACEVVEHFTEIGPDFSRLLAKVSPNGLGIMSTNINDGTPLHLVEYPFIGGHTAYYSGRSLQLVAEHFDPELSVDFRVPLAATCQLGPRKRYILMFRNREVAASISEYFSRNLMAPSEPAVRANLLTRLWRRLRLQLKSAGP